MSRAHGELPPLIHPQVSRPTRGQRRLFDTMARPRVLFSLAEHASPHFRELKETSLALSIRRNNKDASHEVFARW